MILSAGGGEPTIQPSTIGSEARPSSGAGGVSAKEPEPQTQSHADAAAATDLTSFIEHSSHELPRSLQPLVVGARAPACALRPSPSRPACSVPRWARFRHGPDRTSSKIPLLVIAPSVPLGADLRLPVEDVALVFECLPEQRMDAVAMRL